MTTTSLAIVAFVSAFCGVLALQWLWYDVVWRTRSRIARRLAGESPSTIEPSQGLRQLFKDLGRFRAGTRSRLAILSEKFRLLVELSGCGLSPRWWIGGSFVFGAAAAGIAGGLARSWMGSLAAATVAAGLPLLYLLRRHARRIAKLRRQLPDAFDLMARSVQGGQTLDAAFHHVAVSAPAPLGEELAYCREQQQLGLEHDIALREFGRRTGLVELQMFSVAMLVQRRLGGSPVQVLHSLADLVRKRIRLETRVRLLTSEGRLQAAVLILLPFACFAAVWLIDREYLAPLFERPRLLAGAVASLLIGFVWIQRVIRVDY